MKKTKKYWYRLFIGECPVCGSDKSHKERVYGKKPKLLKNRIEYISNTYDQCIEREAIGCF